MNRHPLRYPNGSIILFAKAPVAGAVKTRLAADIGTAAATRLYRTLLRNTAQLCSEACLASVELHVAMNIHHPLFVSLAKQLDIRIRPQCSGDLGERMHTALRETLMHKDFAVLIGSDCPVMSSGYLAQAFEKLDAGCDYVIGPAEDGGYVLLGTRRTQPALFLNMPWSSEHLMNRTRSRLKRFGYNYDELDTLWDIDHLQDLLRWQTMNANTQPTMTHARSLRGHDSEVGRRP